jgi:glycosyltransferase involved in cell wall biosynthesis
VSAFADGSPAGVFLFLPVMTRQLRIAFAMINCNRRDGGARAVNEVAERLAERHQVHLFARKAEEIDLSRIHWRKMPGIPWPEVADFVTYRLLADLRIRRTSFDIIHSIGVNAGAANVITIQNIQPAKRVFLEDQVASAKVSFARKLTRQLYLKTTTRAESNQYRARVNRRAPLYLPVSRGVERDLRTHYNIGDAPVRIIPNAADTHRFRPATATEKERWRRSNGIGERDTLAVFVGGEWRRKGLDLAIRALGRLPQKGVKLLVLGEDAEQSRFEGIAIEAGVRDRVLFLGFRRDVAEAMAACDVFLFPSWYEAFSLATIEAAACGLPILATKINGAEDFLAPGENGFFIEHDPEQIAAILGSVVGNVGDRARMGINARRVVEQRYTWDRVAKLTEEAYLEYLGEDALQTA